MYGSVDGQQAWVANRYWPSLSGAGRCGRCFHLNVWTALGNKVTQSLPHYRWVLWGLPQAHSAFNTVESHRQSCLQAKMAAFKYMKNHHLRQIIDCSNRPQENKLQKVCGNYTADCNWTQGRASSEEKGWPEDGLPGRVKSCAPSQDKMGTVLVHGVWGCGKSVINVCAELSIDWQFEHSPF